MVENLKICVCPIFIPDLIYPHDIKKVKMLKRQKLDRQEGIKNIWSKKYQGRNVKNFQ
jgi:hypothetical protein